jgi:hypothetical protein
MIDARYYKQLARLFSTPVISELASVQRCDLIDYIFQQSGYVRLFIKGATLSEIFEDLYWLLWNHYRCEYIYKNALVSKILLGRHSLNTSTALTEFRAGKSKADLVIVNGTSSVYEIKTELDSLDRLKGQIASYFRVFDKVYVVTHESHIAKVKREIDPSVGLLLLTDRYSLKTIREAASNAANVDPSSIFSCLRQNEYCRIVNAEFGYVPDVPNTLIYTECKKLFTTLPPNIAHQRMIEVLRKRTYSPAFQDFLSEVPKSLKLLCLAQRFTSLQRASFLSALQAEYKLN